MTSNADRRAASFPLRRARSRPEVEFGHIDGAEAHFWADLWRVLDAGARRVCDVGGGAKPALTANQIAKFEIDYVVFDVSAAELGKAPPGYELVEGDAQRPEDARRAVGERGPFDLVLSRWTAEHMRDGRAFHTNVFGMLRPGGAAVHLFPTLYTPPFVVNRMLSEGQSSALLSRAFPARRVKFPAFYSWCRGPSRKQVRRLESVGFEVEHYVGFFGHSFYTSVPPLHAAQRAFTQLLLRAPLPGLTSFGLVVLRRPG
ncbi:MAG TPA: methyltransferase domain-containing protein [Solirubrobacteraceae bacterium]|jgi:hypothetical protein|nr:methyltransferase domain-containing protein [Solirubrobacteraceae bacterium]